MIKWPEPVIAREECSLSTDHYYTEAQLKQAVRDFGEQCAKVCEKQDGVHDAIYAAAIRALIEEIPE